MNKDILFLITSQKELPLIIALKFVFYFFIIILEAHKFRNMAIKRTFDFLDHVVKNHLKEDNFAVKRNNRWEKFSAKEIKEKADNFSYMLIEMGFQKGDKIATVSNN